MPGRNVFTMLEETARQQSAAAALHQPLGGKTGGYQTYSWNDWVSSSRRIGLGLKSLGSTKGEIICIVCETRAEFYIVDLGVMAAGGVSAALYTAYPAADLARSIAGLAPRFVFIEDSPRWEQVAACLREESRPLPEHVVLITGPATPGTVSLAELQEDGRKLDEEQPGEFARIQGELVPGDPAILYLTSGATGEPKMSLTSHAAVLANADMAPTAFPITPADSTIVFLPSAHIAQRIVLEMIPMRTGTPVWFSESLGKLPAELRSIRPTVFLAPPRVWERMYATIQTELRKRPVRAQKVFARALSLGARAARRREEGQRVPIGWRLALVAANRLIFGKVRERLGGRIRIAASGAAPLGRELANFYAAIGLPLMEGYGLTEAGVVTFNPLSKPKSGSIGKTLAGVEIRRAEDGEVQLRTPCLFEGYYRDEAATRSVLTEDGWFATGDIGEVDAEGYWYITGRKKELIVSSNGKKIYPARVENLFKVEPLINQVLLVGDKQPYVTALLTVNTAQAVNLDQPIEAAVQSAVSRVNNQLADFERIRRFRILPSEFSLERGELTPTMKIRRKRVLENYASIVAELYLGKAETS